MTPSFARRHAAPGTVLQAPCGAQATALFGGNASLLIWTRIATTEPFSYTASGTLYPTMVMLAVANSSGSTTPDAISYATQASDSVLRTPALSAPVYLLIGAYCWGSTFGLDEMVQTSSLIKRSIANWVSRSGRRAMGWTFAVMGCWGGSASWDIKRIGELAGWGDRDLPVGRGFPCLGEVVSARDYAIPVAALHRPTMRMRLFVVLAARAAEKEQDRLSVETAHTGSLRRWRVVVKRTTMASGNIP
jgi:hypothetical protein